MTEKKPLDSKPAVDIEKSFAAYLIQKAKVMSKSVDKMIKPEEMPELKVEIVKIEPSIYNLDIFKFQPATKITDDELRKSVADIVDSSEKNFIKYLNPQYRNGDNFNSFAPELITGLNGVDKDKVEAIKTKFELLFMQRVAAENSARQQVESEKAKASSDALQEALLKENSAKLNKAQTTIEEKKT